MIKVFFIYFMSSDLSSVVNGGKKYSITEGRSNRKLFPHDAFFSHTFLFFDSEVHFFFFFFEHFCSSPISIFRVMKNKKLEI